MNRYLSSLGGENNILHWCSLLWLPGWLSSKESACNAGDMGSIPGLERSPGEGNGNSVFLLGKSHGQRSLAGYSQWGYKRIGDNLTTKQQQCQHIHICIYTHTYIYVHTHMYTCTHTHTYISMYIHIFLGVSEHGRRFRSVRI